MLSLVDVCIKDDSSPEVTVSVLINRTTTSTVPNIIITNASSTMQPISTTQKTSTSTSTILQTTSTTKTTQKPTTLTTEKQTTIKTTSTVLPTITPQQQKTVGTTEKIKEHEEKGTKESDFEEVLENKNDEIEDEHEMMPDDMPLSSAEKITNEKLQMHTAESNANPSFIIGSVVIAISSILFAFIVIAIVYQQYRKSTNPLNYRDKSENGTRRADEEFSEIRYLTSDEEVLDFALASADSVTDL